MTGKPNTFAAPLCPNCKDKGYVMVSGRVCGDNACWSMTCDCLVGAIRGKALWTNDGHWKGAT